MIPTVGRIVHTRWGVDGALRCGIVIRQANAPGDTRNGMQTVPAVRVLDVSGDDTFVDVPLFDTEAAAQEAGVPAAFFWPERTP